MAEWWRRATAWRASPATFRRLSRASVVALALIVVTGGAVRLSSSGLGCSTWPACNPGQLVPGWSFHPWVEFGNRLVTVALSVVIGVTAVVSLRLRQPRRDLVWLSWGLVAGVFAQAVVGGLSVIYKLLPGWVMAHFLLSMAVLAAALVLHQRADPAWRPGPPVVRAEVVWLARGLVAASGLTLALGTVVTGTGPHAGSTGTPRLPLNLRDVTQLHADAALLLTGLTVATLVALRIAAVPAALARRGRWLVGLILAQVAIGYAQYFSGLPSGLVEVHVAGATAIWSAAVWLLLGLRVHPAAVAADGEPARPGAPASLLIEQGSGRGPALWER